jgi:hypothetical protein
MVHRRPKDYIPPYNYCDRWCERCRIDKSRCLLWQTEMDDHLHREIDGKGEPTLEEVVDRMTQDARQAIRRVEEQAREMGVDLEREGGEPGEDAPPEEPDPAVGEGMAVARGVAAFLREHGREHPEEADVLRRLYLLVGPKLGRASGRPVDAHEEADAILQAQVAHRALVEMGTALEAIRGRRPELGDAMLDLLALMKRMREDVERRWLSRPCELLEPVEGDAWWGPLRDVSSSLKHFRRP